MNDTITIGEALGLYAIGQAITVYLVRIGDVERGQHHVRHSLSCRLNRIVLARWPVVLKEVTLPTLKLGEPLDRKW